MNCTIFSVLWNSVSLQVLYFHFLFTFAFILWTVRVPPLSFCVLSLSVNLRYLSSHFVYLLSLCFLTFTFRNVYFLFHFQYCHFPRASLPFISLCFLTFTFTLSAFTYCNFNFREPSRPVISQCLLEFSLCVLLLLSWNSTLFFNFTLLRSLHLLYFNF